MKVNLFFNYYQCDRQKEIDLCLKKNKEVFDRVIIVEGRPTFKELFELSRKESPEDINVYCNSDIYFEDTSLLKKITHNDCFALTRYNLRDGKKTFFGRNDSQDAWIFKGHIRDINANFTMGLWGCDNRLAHEIQQAGYKLTNPSLTIVTVHVHECEHRDQERRDDNTVKPPYKTLIPCHL